MSQKKPPVRAEPQSADPAQRSWAAIAAAALLLGVVARAICVSTAPLTSYAPDHRDNMAWSIWAAERGPTRIYDLPERQLIIEVDRRSPPRETPAVVPHACNYPPLAAVVFALQGQVWKVLDGREVTIQLPPPAARQFGVDSVTSRVIDTPAARFTQSLPSLLADVALALGVAALVRALRGGRGSRVWDALAGGLTFIAPPVFLDSAYWGQTDSWVSAWMVWSLWALAREKWWLAGVLWGAAMMTKPQGILLAPIFAYVALARWIEVGGSIGRGLQLLKTGAAALLTVVVIALPFMIQDRGHADGPLRWFHRSYGETVGGDLYPRTTLSAFNFWWLDWMAGGASAAALDSKAPMLGMSKDRLGKVMLIVAILAAGGLGLRRRSADANQWMVFGLAVLLAAFALPTRVHERYIYYCLPVLIALTVLDWRIWTWPLLALLIVGSAEMTTFRWLDVRIEGPRRFATGLAVLTLLSLVYVLVVMAIRAVQARRPRTVASRAS